MDALSLWLCVAERTSPQTFTAPGPLTVTLTPLGDDHIEVRPWPFDVGHLKLTIAGRRVANLPYANSDELAAAASEPVVLSWRLVPGE